MNIIVSTESIDLLVDRNDEYESGYDGITGATSLQSALTNDDYSLTYTSTSDSSHLAQELRLAEATYENKRFLMPGAYGTLTFYIRPKLGHETDSVRLTLTLGGYKDEYVEETNEQTGVTTSTKTVVPVTSARILALLKGHILFFTGRTGASFNSFVYTGQITDGSFTYDMSEHSTCSDPGKTDCYKIMLYWEWPLTYADIEENISTSSPAVTKRFPEATGTYLAEHPTYFFPFNLPENDPDGKSNSYNDGDQTIGDGVNYFVAYLSAM